MAAQYLGRVVGTKMDKTAKVMVTRMKLHPIIKKYWNHRKVYFAHDEKNECIDGDLVIIKECLPITKNKSFKIDEIVEKAPTLRSTVKTMDPNSNGPINKTQKT